MKHHLQPVQLVSMSADGSTVKRGALATFKLLRSAMEQAKTVPGIVQQAATDIREAWEESSRPNA